MRIINLVDSLDNINFGIWNAALFTAPFLKKRYGVRSEVWAPRESDWDSRPYGLEAVRLFNSTSKETLESLVRESAIKPENTIIASHGVWQFPSRWGHKLSQRGFPWIAAPQGMLEPYPVSQKRWKKKMYRHLFEDRFLNASSVLRAVSSPEQARLSKMFPQHSNIHLIPNGVEVPEFDISTKPNPKVKSILFLGRLHKKKCPTELVEAFCKLPAEQKNQVELLMVGPDQGEEAKIRELLTQYNCDRVKLLGPTFGDAKNELMANATFFALPSRSEGFPTSIIEAMSYGCLPIISPGCNFPEAEGLAISVQTNVDSIRRGLSTAILLDDEEIVTMQQASAEFVRTHYSNMAIADIQHQMLSNLLS